MKIKVKGSNYLSRLVQKRIAYRGTHVRAFNFEAKPMKSFRQRKPLDITAGKKT